VCIIGIFISGAARAVIGLFSGGLITGEGGGVNCVGSVVIRCCCVLDVFVDLIFGDGRKRMASGY
jgi:hypothetical protein